MLLISRIIYILVIVCMSGLLHAQEVNYDIKTIGTIDEILDALSKISNKSIIYNPDIFNDEIHEASFSNDSFDEIIRSIINTQYYEVIQSDLSIIIKRRPRINYTGQIQQLGSLVSLPYAAIKVKNKEIYTVSDENGRFQLSTILPSEIQISYLGHRDTIITIHENNAHDVIIILRPDNQLSEVIIHDNDQNQELLNRYSYQGDKIKTLTKDIPGIGGNNDLLNATRGIAGVSSGSGGIGGFFIRGGNNSQNLFLLDGVPIYNPFHSFGLTSIVTSDISQSIQVYKSGFRARHADKSAGIIDINIKEGNSISYKFNGEFNSQDGMFSAQGPVINDQTSFFISGRSTTISGPFNNIVKSALYGNSPAENKTQYYDIVFKLKTHVNPKNLIEVTTYKSDDVINGEIESFNERTENEQRLKWGNEMYSLKWMSKLSDQVFSNSRISANSYFTEYQSLNEFGDDEQNILFVDNSSMNRDLSMETRIDALIGQQTRLQLGLNYLSKEFSPNSDILTEDSDEIDYGIGLSIEQIVQANADPEELESNLLTGFGELTFENLNHRLVLGVRMNKYNTDDYNHFITLPRLSYNYFLNKRHKFEVAISRTAQYDHLLSLSDIFLPQDIWYPSVDQLVPQDGWHYNLAYIYSSDHLKFRHELYSKRIKGITYSSYNFLEGGFEELNLHTVQGVSQIYGYEISGEYSNSALQLMSSLSISKSTNQFDAVNLGNGYASQFDRLVEFNMLGSYKINDNLKFGFVNYIASGHPTLVTEPVNEELGLVPFDINPLGSKNSKRSGLSHRLDVSLTYAFTSGMVQHRIKANIYNSYNISQPLYFTNGDTGLQPNFSLPAIFSVAYSFNF